MSENEPVQQTKFRGPKKRKPDGRKNDQTTEKAKNHKTEEYCFELYIRSKLDFVTKNSTLIQNYELNKKPQKKRLSFAIQLMFLTFLTFYDVTRVQIKPAEFWFSSFLWYENNQY